MGLLHRRYRKRRRSSNSEGPPRRNPPLITELAEWIGPGFAAFAVTRFGTRIAAQMVAKKAPAWGKHVGAVASIGAFLAAWLLANRVRFLARYQTPIAVGAGIAAAQSLIQLYIPKLGWMVSDASPELAVAAAPAQPQLPKGFQVVEEDPDVYTYSETYDAARVQAAPGGGGVPQEEVAEIDIEGDVAEMQGVGWAH